MAETTGIKSLAHNTGLADASQALQVLQRIQREFAPLLQKRGWAVRKLQEMCCCAKGGGVARAPGVLGMNHSGAKGKYSTKIEIRLREPGSSHAFKDYESEVVGTMCHELSHIVHHNHSADFYELMEVLHNEFDATRSKAAGGTTVVPFLGEGAKVDGARHNPTSLKDARRRAVDAAEKRAKAQQLMGSAGGQRLGGGISSTSTSGSSSSRAKDAWRALPPKVAALRAAERRLRDDHWCPMAAAFAAAASDTGHDPARGRPAEQSAGNSASHKSTVSTRVSADLPGKASSGKLPAVMREAPLRKRQRTPAATITSTLAPVVPEAQMIDLTTNDDKTDTVYVEDDSVEGAHLTSPGVIVDCSHCNGCTSCSSKADKADEISVRSSLDCAWECPSCTLFNAPFALACDACALERPSGK